MMGHHAAPRRQWGKSNKQKIIWIQEANWGWETYIGGKSDKKLIQDGTVNTFTEKR